LRRLFREADVVITRPVPPLVAGWLRASEARIVYDLCDPVPLDLLETQLTSSRERQLVWSTVALDHFLDALESGHHFICSGDRQRDLYLGAMLALRLISPAAYRADPTFRTFLDQVPFGIPSQPPQRVEGAGPKARLARVGDDTQVVLWNGGIWNWLDPVTAVTAAVTAAERNPRIRLVFMYAAGALDGGPETREARAAYELARRLGALDEIVFFHDAVVPFVERPSWLLDADCIISTHREHLETNFAFRTRLLDCFWAGLPAVCTRGDELSERLERCGGAVTVPSGDADAVAEGILEVLDREPESYRQRLVEAGRDMVWAEAVEPLRRIIALDGPPRALGDPWARRLSAPLRRGRSAAVRAVRSVRR
jgi:glycosyltransferase involved in cell wall biosynthesis